MGASTGRLNIQVRNVEIDVYVPEVSTWIPQTFRGRVFAVGNGEEVVLFTAGVLASAIARTTQSICAWERDGKLPASTFEVEGVDPRIKRWYSETQIRMAQNCFRRLLRETFGSENAKYSTNQHFPHTEFFDYLKKHWNPTT